MLNLSLRSKQLLLLAGLFLALTIFCTNTFSLSLIQQDKTILGSPLTVGDTLTFIGLFGTCITLVIFMTQRRSGNF